MAAPFCPRAFLLSIVQKAPNWCRSLLPVANNPGARRLHPKLVDGRAATAFAGTCLRYRAAWTPDASNILMQALTSAPRQRGLAAFFIQLDRSGDLFTLRSARGHGADLSLRLSWCSCYIRPVCSFRRRSPPKPSPLGTPAARPAHPAHKQARHPHRGSSSPYGR